VAHRFYTPSLQRAVGMNDIERAVDFFHQELEIGLRSGDVKDEIIRDGRLGVKLMSSRFENHNDPAGFSS
jgi:hypothetical protein